MRSESLQKVPVAIKAFNRRAIDEAGITSMRDYVELTPNVYLQETQNTGFAFVNIRGLATQRNTDQAVAMAGHSARRYAVCGKRIALVSFTCFNNIFLHAQT